LDKDYVHVHLNFYFLVHLIAELKPLLQGSWLLEAFTQEKDEVVFAFAKKGEDFYLRFQLGSGIQFISFPVQFHRARRNSKDLFAAAIEKQVIDLFVTPHDRSFGIRLENDMLLFFKCHGSKSNVVLYENGKGVEQFHKSYPDLTLIRESLAKPAHFSIDSLVQHNFDFKILLPALGKEPIHWLDSNGFASASQDQKIELVCQMLETLHHPKQFYVLDQEGKAVLSLFSEGQVLGTYSSAIEAANALVKFHYTFSLKNKERASNEKLYLQKKAKLESYLRANKERLAQLTHENVFEQTAHLIMANLAQIPPRAESVVLFDFYHDIAREIKLKKDLSPQKNAELYYRKAKNVGEEINQLQKTIEIKTKELTELEVALEHAGETASPTKKPTKTSATKESLPYKRFEFEGFEIRVGKDAKSNDELIQKHASKNDMWMHARGYAGSHVILRKKSGIEFPMKVIEKAASLAAWYSKGKNDSHCPVIVTEMKYVRKSKGMAVGQVRVEKEKTWMVSPCKFDN
jgi:hypothetical protein